MRRLILQMQISIDGYVSAANSNLAWQLWDWGDSWNWDNELKREFNDTIDSIDCILLSPKMAAEGYLAHWGRAAQRYPTNPNYAFAKRIMEASKVVPTKTLGRSKWERTVLAKGELTLEVSALKGRHGRNIITFGGVGLASALLSAGLVDEIQLYVNPTAVGDGLSIFKDVPGLHLNLIASNRYECGIVVSKYAPIRHTR